MLALPPAQSSKRSCKSRTFVLLMRTGMPTSPSTGARIFKLAGALLPSRTAVPVRRGPRVRLESHVDAPDPSDLASVRRWVRSTQRPTAIDLFSGAGGLSLGLQDAGFSVLAGADSDPFAVETYLANLGGLCYLGDLSDPADFLDHLRAWGIDSTDLLAGGVPCQPFSRAGRSKIRSLVKANVRAETDPRVDLWHSFIRVAEALQPRAILLENVPDLAEWEDGAILIGFCESLRTLGYETDARVLNAYEHGVPQFRSRLFIVGQKVNATFRWPKLTNVRPTLRDAIGDLPVVNPGQRLERISYSGPQTSLQRRLRIKVSPSDRAWIRDHITRDVRPDDAQAFALLAPGGTYVDLPKRLRRYRSDIFTDKYKRLEWDGLCRTITAHIAKDAYWYIHPDQDRTLSIREAARVQTFPDRFRFAGEPSHRYRQIGNAVPPLLAQAVGGALLGMLRQPVRVKRFDTGLFRSKLARWHGSNNRNYPWRAGAKPWIVLLGEICLNKRGPEVVAAAYPHLVKLGSTPRRLLRNYETLRQLMTDQGLSVPFETARRIARVIIDAHGGFLPSTKESLLLLPGVGDYAASAVESFGYGRVTLLLDANTERVASRLMGRNGSTPLWQKRLYLHKLAGASGPDRAFNHGLMDLGAMVCVVTAPRCLTCPVSAHCSTFSKSMDS
jgi:DNA (cytosine-5)-methyltransferase 1